MSNFRILEMTESFPSDRAPLTALFVKAHAEHLSKYSNLSVIVFVRLLPPKQVLKRLSALKKWLKQIYHILREKKGYENGYKVIFIPYISLPRPWFEFLNIILLKYLYSKKIYKIALSFKPDVLVVHWVSPLAILAWKVANQLGIPLVIDVHEDPDNVKLYYPFLQRIWIKALKLADAIIVHSEVNKIKLNRLGLKPEKIYKIYLGIEDIYINGSEYLRSKMEDSKFIVITVSHLSNPCKNINLLLCSIPEVRKRYENIKLVIIGDGRLKKSLEQLSLDLGIADHVNFKGALNPTKVKEELSKADLFVLPSVRESFGLVFIEAIASGLPVIGYKEAGAIFELNELGVPVFKLENVTPQSIAEAISFAYENYSNIKEQILKYRDEIVNRFSWDNHAVKYVTILKKLIQDNKLKNG